MLEHLFQRVHFRTKFPDNPRIRIFIDYSMINNSLGTVSIAKCGQSFFVIITRGRNGGHHYSLTVATKVILQESKRMKYE